MNNIRKVVSLSTSRPTQEGAGVHLRRAFGFHDPERFDPFLLLDDFRSDDPRKFLAGFPWHPHRGIETITYMLEGAVEHGDSIGNKGVIQAGGVQWMTAGRGIIHQEMPKSNASGHMGGFQLWSNLPASRKMMEPRYQEFTQADFPVADWEGGASIVMVCGTLGDFSGPVDGVESEPIFCDVTVPPDARIRIPTPPGHTVLAYIFEGQGFFDDRHSPLGWEIRQDGYTDRIQDARLQNHHLALFGEGDALHIESDERAGVRFLLMMGNPLQEPIAWGGPIVMNTREELETAFRQLDEGTFLA